jgi:hypothetical protein
LVDNFLPRTLPSPLPPPPVSTIADILFYISNEKLLNPS